MKQKQLLRTLLAAVCLFVGTSSVWGETVWETYKTWTLDGLTASELSNYESLTNLNNENKTFYINEGVSSFSVDDVNSALYGLTFQGAYNNGWKGAFNTTTASGNRGFVMNGGAAKIIIPNLEAGQRVSVTCTGETDIVSAQLSGLTRSGTVSTGIVAESGDVTIARKEGATYISSILVENPVGEKIYATLEHTAGAQWGSNTGASTVDAEKEHYNNDASDAWAGCAYAKFSYTIPDGATITDAKLTYYVNQGGKSGRDDIIYYMNKDFDLNWATFAGQTGTDLRNTSSRTNKAVTAAPTGGTGERGPLVQDVTTAVSAICSGGQSYIIFQWTGNAGAADLYGKGSSTKAPVLSITYTTAATYTATFTETNSLNPTITIYSDAGRTSPVTNGTLADKTTYYYRATLQGYDNYEGSFTVNGANPSVNFTMTAATPVESLTVKAKIGSEYYTIKTIDLTDKYVGDVVTITYPRLWLVGTTLYSTTESAHSGGYYKWSYTLDGNDAVVEYNTTEATGVVYYSEGENIEGMTADASNNADIRCSDGKGGRSSEELSLTSLGSGIYKLTSKVWGNSGCSYTYRAAGTDVLTHTTTGALNDNNVYFNVLSGTAAIKVQGSGTGNGKVIDYVYIQKLDDSSASIYNGDFENNTWGEGWLGTGTDKAKEFAVQTSSQTWGATGKFAEMWTGTNSSYTTEAHLRQILVNVPAGDYTLSADILNNVQSSGGVLYAKVGNDSEITTAAESATGAKESVSFTVAEPSVVVVGFKTTSINGKNGWIAVDNFTLKQFIPATITSAGWATLYTDKALEFSGVEGLTAYTATVTNNSVTLTKVQNNVPANTGVVLEGAADTYYIPVVASSKTAKGDLLGSADATAFDAYSGYTLYILTQNGNDVQFNPCTSGSIAAGKAFLKVATDNNNSGGAKALSVVFANDPTGISTVNATETAQPVKRIVNGKLVIEKNGKHYNAAGAEF